MKSDVCSMQLSPDTDVVNVEDLPDFCAKWPEIAPQAREILLGPETPDKEALVKWMIALTDRVHFSDFR